MIGGINNNLYNNYQKPSGEEFYASKERRAEFLKQNSGTNLDTLYDTTIKLQQKALERKKEQEADKKKLDYNHKEISTKLMRVKSSAMAANVVAQAGIKVKELYAKLKSGEYDAEEVMSAILHAEQIEIAAIRRRDNLKMEEQAERKASKEEQEELLESGDMMSLDEIAAREQYEVSKEEMEELQQQIMEQMSEELQEEMEALMEETQSSVEEIDANEMDEMMKALSGDISAEDLEEIKKKHRADELQMINKADMDYLKMQFQRLARQKAAIKAGAMSFGSGSSGASGSGAAGSSSGFSASRGVMQSYSASAGGGISVSVSGGASAGAAIDVSG